MPTIDLLQQRGPTVYYLDTGVAVFRSLVNPEGAIEAKKDSLCLYDGGVYVKSTDTGNTGWVSVGSDAGSLIYPLAQWTQRSSGGGDRGLMKTRTRCGLCRYDYDAARSRSSRFCNRCLKKFGPRSGKAKHHPVSKLLRAWR